jgi:hypothetical protein
VFLKVFINIIKYIIYSCFFNIKIIIINIKLFKNLGALIVI